MRNDLIRRQDAIERATKEHDFYKGATIPTDKARRDELLNVMCWLGELPSAQPEPQWIPCSERLPEDLTSVIAHRKDGGIFMLEYFDTSPTDECWIDDRMNVYSFYDVTHWMPLPDPPKGEQE